MRTLILLLAFLPIIVQAQLINQDADGKSSIIVGGGSLSLDLSQAAFKLNYYSPTTRKAGFMWGIDIQGKSKTGVADLFSKDKFVPESNSSILLGGYNSWRKNRKENPQIDALDKERDECQEFINENGEDAEAKYAALAKDAFKDVCKDQKDKVEKIKKLIRKAGYKYLVDSILSYKIDDESEISDECKRKFNDALSLFKTQVNADELIGKIIASEKRKDAIPGLITRLKNANVRYTGKIKYYFRAGVGTTGFTYDRGAAITNADDRFSDTLHVGPFFEIGSSMRIKNSLLGIALGEHYLSNMSYLKKSSYNNIAYDTLSGSVLQSTDEVIAYSGSYKEKWGFYLNLDFLQLISISDSNQYLAIGPYLRLNAPGESKLLDKFKATAGVGAYFLDGKTGRFQGGIYIQSGDISGRTESNFGKTISFGVVAKVLFSTLTID